MLYQHTTQQLQYIVWVVLSLQHQWQLASEVPLEVVYLTKPLQVEPHLPVSTGVVERELPIQYIAIVESGFGPLTKGIKSAMIELRC